MGMGCISLIGIGKGEVSLTGDGASVESGNKGGACTKVQGQNKVIGNSISIQTSSSQQTPSIRRFATLPGATKPRLRFLHTFRRSMAQWPRSCVEMRLPSKEFGPTPICF